jgi:hypothetical protein
MKSSAFYSLPLLIALSACTSNSGDGGVTAQIKEAQRSASLDRAGLRVIVRQCLRALDGREPQESILTARKFKRSSISKRVYQRVTSKDFLGLTDTFDRLEYREGRYCEFTNGTESKARFAAFENSAEATLRANGFVRNERKGLFGKVVDYRRASDGLKATIGLTYDTTFQNLLVIRKSKRRTR